MADSGRISGDCRHRAGYGEPCDECKDAASSVLTMNEAEAVERFRGQASNPIGAGDLGLCTAVYSDDIFRVLALIDRLTAKVRAAESAAAEMRERAAEFARKEEADLMVRMHLYDGRSSEDCRRIGYAADTARYIAERIKAMPLTKEAAK